MSQLPAAILAFDVESIPDVPIVRREFSDILNEGMTDDEVVERVEHHLSQTKGNSFLPISCHRIIALSGTLLRPNNAKPVHISTFRHSFSDNQTTYDEKGALTDFFGKLSGLSPYDTQLVSWNGINFDLPLMILRSLKHLVAAPQFWDKNSQQKRFNNYTTRYHDLHTDLMDKLALHGMGKVSLDSACAVAGIAGKNGMDGSQVYRLYQEGKLNDIAAYCETDTVNTMILYLRYCVMKGSISKSEYQQYYDLIKAQMAKKSPEHPILKDYFEAM